MPTHIWRYVASRKYIGAIMAQALTVTSNSEIQQCSINTKGSNSSEARTCCCKMDQCNNVNYCTHLSCDHLWPAGLYPPKV